MDKQVIKFDFKKFLPLILLGVGIIALVSAFLFLNSSKSNNSLDENEVSTEIAFKDRPFASLTPSSDGHWLTLKVQKIGLNKASSLDYELLYTLPDGRTQGVPGTVDLKGEKEFERKLLLGSESSGKYRYDEGVKEGSLTVRIRDQKGKLLAKFATKWHLQNDEVEITSVDQNLVYKLDKKPKDIYFVTMETFGLLDSSITSVESGPYGIFSSSELPEGSAEGFTKTSTNLYYK